MRLALGLRPPGFGRLLPFSPSAAFTLFVLAR